MNAVIRKLAGAGLTLALSAGVVSMAGSSAEAHGRSNAVDRATVTEFGDESAATGQSTMIRSRRGALGVVRTGSLVPGDAYTVWAVVFNNPAGCVDGCDGSDVANPAAEGVSMLGTGKVVRTTRSTFVVRVRAGDELTDPMGAEIHFVVRTHGPAIPGLVHEQTSSLNDGCPPNTCANVLMAKHD